MRFEKPDLYCADCMDAEAIPPKVYPETRYSGELLACGDCRHELEEKKPMFCPYCGKRIRW